MGLWGFSERLFSWKRGVKQQRKCLMHEKSSKKGAFGKGEQTACEVVKPALGSLIVKWEQEAFAKARIRSSNKDFPLIVSGVMEDAETAFLSGPHLLKAGCFLSQKWNTQDLEKSKYSPTICSFCFFLTSRSIDASDAKENTGQTITPIGPVGPDFYPMIIWVEIRWWRWRLLKVDHTNEIYVTPEKSVFFTHRAFPAVA